MKRVYVTESGAFDEKGRFHVGRVIGVDSMARLAVSYPLSVGCYRHRVDKGGERVIVFYKQQFSNRGYRITSIEMC